MKTQKLVVFALLSLINIQQYTSGIKVDQNSEAVVQITEQNRYIGSNGEFLNLDETQGHLRLELTKVKKYKEAQPMDKANLFIESCIGTDLISTKENSLSESETEQTIFDDVTHCPINKEGSQVVAHIFQMNLEDNAYVSELYVGNPPQLLRGLFDTGSTNTWILNSKVRLPGNAYKQRSYNSRASTSYIPTKQAATIYFGSGSLAGHFVTDDVRLGSCDGTKSSGQIHIKNQKFGNVVKQSTIFTGSNFEAIVGMAYPALAEPGVRPVFDEMIEQKLLKSNVFAFYLTSKQDERYGLKSDLTFGYYDATKFSGPVHWNKILFQYMFGVQLDDIKINGKNLNICEGKIEGCLITFDSGTSLMSVPNFAFASLVRQKIPTSNTFVECDNKNEFGDFTLVINGVDYPLTPDEWMFDPQYINLAQAGTQTKLSMGPLGPQLMAQLESSHNVTSMTQIDKNKIIRKKRNITQKMKDKVKICASTIMKMEIKNSMFLVGDVFMRKYYTIFDRDNNRVGLAKANTPEKVVALQQAGYRAQQEKLQSKK